MHRIQNKAPLHLFILVTKWDRSETLDMKRTTINAWFENLALFKVYKKVDLKKPRMIAAITRLLDRLCKSRNTKEAIFTRSLLASYVKSQRCLNETLASSCVWRNLKINWWQKLLVSWFTLKMTLTAYSFSYFWYGYTAITLHIYFECNEYS